jgi:hypothetical protein
MSEADELRRHSSRGLRTAPTDSHVSSSVSCVTAADSPGGTLHGPLQREAVLGVSSTDAPPSRGGAGDSDVTAQDDPEPTPEQAAEAVARMERLSRLSATDAIRMRQRAVEKNPMPLIGLRMATGSAQGLTLPRLTHLNATRWMFSIRSRIQRRRSRLAAVAN